MPPRTPFPFGGGRFPTTPFPPPPTQNSMFPRMFGIGQTPQVPQMNQGGGGFLARLFNRGAQAGGMPGNPMQAIGGMNPARGFGALNSAQQFATGANPAVGSGSGGLLKTLANPGAVNGFLSNTQNFLKAAQSVGPMVQQYGPLVRNLPAMWKIYRGFKNADTNDDNDESKSTEAEAKKKETPKEKSTTKATIKKEESSSFTESSAKPIVKQTKGASVPKLYI